MRTKVLNHFHTFHPEAQAELSRLSEREGELTTAIARLGESLDPSKKRRASDPTLPGDDLRAELAEVRADMDECRKTMASGVVRIVIKGLNRGEFRRLLLAHPPREDDPADAQLGYNVDTFGEAMIAACIVSTLAHELNGGEPVPNEWGTWADEMTNGQWQEIFTHCMTLTNGGNPTTFPR